MIAIEMEFDGGFSDYAKAIDEELDNLKNLDEFFQSVIDYFEGNAEGLESPILKIFKSDGTLIGGNWGAVSKTYAAWKQGNWRDERKYSVPLGYSNQVLSGAQYDSLMNSNNPNAIRKATKTAMVYGTSLDYAAENQSRFHILDFYPEMERGVDRVLVRFLQKIKALEVEE